jgi:hypothetical protein
LREITHWVAGPPSGVTVPLDDVSGGETLFFWIQTAWLLVAAVAATAAWSLLDRQRRSYAAGCRGATWRHPSRSRRFDCSSTE